jgi:radical SAM superfamily enzyme YgiQ (UPF0313 family)
MMMAKKVTLVELSVYEGILPLASGYLQAYACRDQNINKAYDFEKYSVTVKTPYSTILRDLQESDSDVYAFSCYLWNMGLVKSLLKPLIRLKPRSHFMLGGPQVMNHAYKYLDPQYENLVLCNGEGERTFSAFLNELADSKPDFSNVRGLSFYKDRELVSTEKQERIRDLDEIPSPFLGGIFDKPYTMAVFETNRGCPFSCGFCYWGAATTSKVFKFNEERIREELTWLSKHNYLFIYLTDANWGIYPRDVGLSEHIADLSRRHKTPGFIYYSAAKNRPERTTQITEIFTKAGIITSQPVSLQTMSETSLELIDRKNIRLSSYVELQERLNEKKISSYTELIWPLPGETLSSLKAGVDKLCEAKAGTIVIYPQLLLNNTSLYKRQNELGLVTKRIDEEIGEVDIVVQTADVSYQEFQEGMRFFYALHLLHNTRSLFAVSADLNRSRNIKFSDIFSAFSGFCKQHKDNPVVEFCEKSIEEHNYYDVFNMGKAVHFALHAHRESFDELLYQFISSQAWWDDDETRALFEVDLINNPYLYSNTPIKEKKYSFEHLRVLEVTSKGYIVDVPETSLSLLNELVEIREVGKQTGNVFLVDHKKMQYPFMKSRSLDHNAGYCHGMILRIKNIIPDWTRLSYVKPAQIKAD